MILHSLNLRSYYVSFMQKSRKDFQAEMSKEFEQLKKADKLKRFNYCNWFFNQIFYNELDSDAVFNH